MRIAFSVELAQDAEVRLEIDIPQPGRGTTPKYTIGGVEVSREVFDSAVGMLRLYAAVGR